jgi:DNA-directed RNA polymerase subunit L
VTGKYIQILKGCISLIITVAVLYAGQAVWRNYAIDLPLDKALNKIEGVEEVAWDSGNSINGSMSIYVKLGSISNLQKTYEEINKIIEQTLKGREYSLEITDDRSPELEQAYYDIHHFVQKSIVDGDFPTLEVKVREKAGTIEAKAKVYVDEQNIYIQIDKKDSSLFAVTKRQKAG